MQHMYPNSHASATPQIYMPMNNMMSSVNQVETPYVGTSNAMQQSVSSFYSSANNLQYANPNVRVDRGIGHATTIYSANYAQTSYATPHATNFSAPYATVDVHHSAPHLHGHGRISETSTGGQMPSPTTVAYHVPPTQLQNFGNISSPKESKSIGGATISRLVIENKLTFSWDLCNSIRQELIEGGKPHDFAANDAVAQCCTIQCTT